MKTTLAIVAVLGLFALNCVRADGYGNGGGYMKGGWSGYGGQGYGKGGYHGYGKSGGYHGYGGYSGYGKKGGYVDEITHYSPYPVYGGAVAGPYAGGYAGSYAGGIGGDMDGGLFGQNGALQSDHSLSPVGYSKHFVSNPELDQLTETSKVSNKDQLNYKIPHGMSEVLCPLPYALQTWQVLETTNCEHKLNPNLLSYRNSMDIRYKSNSKIDKLNDLCNCTHGKGGISILFKASQWKSFGSIFIFGVYLTADSSIDNYRQELNALDDLYTYDINYGKVVVAECFSVQSLSSRPANIMKATLAIVAVLGLFALNCVRADGYGNGGGYMKGGWSGYGNGGHQGYGKASGYHGYGGYSGYGKKGGYVDEIVHYSPYPVYGGAVAGPYAGGLAGSYAGGIGGDMDGGLFGQNGALLMFFFLLLLLGNNNNGNGLFGQCFSVLSLSSRPANIMKSTLAIVAVLGLFALNCVRADGYGNGGGYMKGGWSGYGNGGHQGYGKAGGYHGYGGYSGYGKKGGYVDEIVHYSPYPVYGGAVAGPYAGGLAGSYAGGVGGDMDGGLFGQNGALRKFYFQSKIITISSCFSSCFSFWATTTMAMVCLVVKPNFIVVISIIKEATRFTKAAII
ncbi:unnamed protein product [Mytilus coruscus]|uniref:Uncharacterized protein n=1 Tax=Mytilus coruscus TaxID=42192 RepID=A0A6J8ELC1_MYTCO|nr:unnamed protein product [Mytilus coruscus]